MEAAPAEDAHDHQQQAHADEQLNANGPRLSNGDLLVALTRVSAAGCHLFEGIAGGEV